MAFLRRDVIEKPPYDQLAALYDYVMRHVDYVEWADYIEQLFRWCGANPHKITEAACGTGALALILADRGYSVSGYDLSEAMISVAKAKARARDENLPQFAVADMKSLPHGEADVVLCVYDSINYCSNTGELAVTFRSFRKAVRAGGIAIFDVTTEANSLRYFRDYRYRERHDGYMISRHSVYHPETRTQTNEFVFEGPDLPGRVKEMHRQQIFSLKEVLESIPAFEWSVLGAFDGYTLDPPDDDTERIHIVMRALG